mgnify:CR=1 FL=1
MAAITSSNVANAIVKLVAVDALPVLVGNLVMGNLVNRDYEPILAHAGDTVNVPIPPIMVANNIAEGGTVQTQNPNLGNAQIVLNTHAEATFQIPDVTKVLAVPDLLKIYMEPAVAALAQDEIELVLQVNGKIRDRLQVPADITETDLRIRDAVMKQLDWDPEVDASAVGVAAKDGVITLTGYVPDYPGRLAAEQRTSIPWGPR